MNKFFKIAGIVIGALLILLLLIPLLLKNKIGEIVKYQANEMLEARVDFDRLGISLFRHFPKASIDLKDLTVVGTGAFEQDTLLAARRISVVVDVMSLLGDSGFEVTRVIFDRPQVQAIKTPDGAVNWNILKPADSEPEQPEQAEESKPFSLSIKDLRIDDAQLIYADDSSRTRFGLRDLDLRLRGDLAAEKSTLSLHLGTEGLYFISGKSALLSDASVEINADVEADLVANRFTFRNNTFRLNEIVLGLNGWLAMQDEAVDMDLQLNTEKVHFKDLLSLIPAFYQKDFAQLSAGGQLSLNAWAKGTMQGSSLPAFGVRLEVQDGSFRYASLPASVDRIAISATADGGGAADNTVLEISNLSFTLADNPFRATLRVTHPASDPAFRATASGTIDLAAIGDVYPLGDSVTLNGTVKTDIKAAAKMSDIENGRYADMQASGSFTIEDMEARLAGLPAVKIDRAEASITPAQLSLDKLSLQVGRSDLSASGMLTNYLAYILKGDLLSGKLQVRSELLDLNELLGADNVTETEAPADTTSLEAFVVPDNLDLRLDARIGRLLFQQMDIEDFAGNVAMQNRKVRLNNLSMRIFGGTMQASGSYSTADGPLNPALALNAKIAGATFSETFRQLDMVRRIVPVFEKTGGDYSLDLDMNLRLDKNMNPRLQTLDARGVLRSDNIRIQQLKAFDALATALKDDRLRNIEARNVRIPFSIADGRITTQPFDLKIGNINVNLNGTTGLDGTIDYAARIQLPAGTAQGYLQRVNANIGGTFASPKITLDLKQAAEDAVKQVVSEQLEKLTGGQGLDEQLQRQADRLRAEAQAAGEKLVAAAREQGERLVEKADNPITKLAARKSAEALVKQAEQQAAKLTAEAERQIDELTKGRTGN